MKSENFDTSFGNKSPITIDFGFLKNLNLVATFAADNMGKGDEKVVGIWQGFPGR